MQEYHLAWLSAHPHRTAEWLAEKLKEGFDVHHLDGNHDNNDPANLVLIEHTDHMMIHGGRFLGRLHGKTGGKRRKRTVTAPDGTVIVLMRRERADHALKRHEKFKLWQAA